MVGNVHNSAFFVPFALSYSCFCCCGSVNVSLFRVARKHGAKLLLCRVPGSGSRSARHHKNSSGSILQGEIRESGGCQHFLAHCVAKIYEATIHRPFNSLSSLHLQQMYNVRSPALQKAPKEPKLFAGKDETVTIFSPDSTTLVFFFSQRLNEFIFSVMGRNVCFQPWYLFHSVLPYRGDVWGALRCCSTRLCWPATSQLQSVIRLNDTASPHQAAPQPQKRNLMSCSHHPLTPTRPKPFQKLLHHFFPPVRAAYYYTLFPMESIFYYCH